MTNADRLEHPYMSGSGPTSNEVRHKARKEVIELIADAWRGGRVIVPLFGAGCSYDAGMPIVTGIQHFLYKFRLYLSKGLFAYHAGFDRSKDLTEASAKQFGRYKNRPAEYLAHFG